MSPIVPSVSTEHFTEQLAVPLPRYAQLVDYSEAAFFGVNQVGQEEHACRTIWTRWQRQAIARELLAAQGEFWKHANYPFVPTFIADERHDYNHTVLLNNCNVIALGTKVVSLVASGVAVSHTADPAIVTAFVSFTDPDELHVYHPGTDYEIIPSKITIAGGTATIEIPRVRMVAMAHDDTPEDGLDYTDTSLFEATVDISRIYLDPTYQVQVFASQPCATPPSWMNYWNDAYLREADIGHIRLARNLSVCGVEPHYMQVNYLCGLTTLSAHAEDAIVRLAHSRMPSEPCGCDFLKARWEQDKNVPQVLDTERENCPFGMSDGAWQAWKFLQDLVCYRARSL